MDLFTNDSIAKWIFIFEKIGVVSTEWLEEIYIAPCIPRSRAMSQSLGHEIKLVLSFT